MAMDSDANGQRRHLLTQLKEGSEFLETQTEDLMRIWQGFKPKVFSYYETLNTPTVRKVNKYCTLSRVILTCHPL